MSSSDRENREGKSEKSQPSETPETKWLPPRASGYVKLILGVWAFLLVQAFLFTALLGSSRGIFFLAMLLAWGFLLAAVFDYAWLRWGRRK